MSAINMGCTGNDCTITGINKLVRGNWKGVCVTKGNTILIKNVGECE